MNKGLPIIVDVVTKIISISMHHPAFSSSYAVFIKTYCMLHFFNLRCCYRAQWEIREMANLMLAEVQKVAPTLFKNAGASCVNTGRCPEGEMTCGHLAEMLKLRQD